MLRSWLVCWSCALLALYSSNCVLAFLSLVQVYGGLAPCEAGLLFVVWDGL